MTEPVTHLQLSVPYPPTSNHNTMVVRGRRISSPKYRAWRELAEREIKHAVGGLQVQGPYAISYTAQRPDRRRRDVENLPKSVSDALQAAGAIVDDADCVRSTVAWSNEVPAKSARVFVTIERTRP